MFIGTSCIVLLLFYGLFKIVTIQLRSKKQNKNLAVIKHLKGNLSQKYGEKIINLKSL